MRSRRLFWYLIAPYILIVLAAFVLLTWYAQHAVRNYYYAEINRALASTARLIETRVGPDFRTASPADLEALCRRIAEVSEQRITLIKADGTVLADTHDAAASMENHGGRPEVLAAREHGQGRERRYSHTVGENLLYFAHAMRAPDGELHGYVRVAYALTAAEATLRNILLQIAGGGMAAAAATVIISLFLTRRLTLPLRTMQLAAHRFARGDFTERVPAPRIAEFQDLSQAMNGMAGQLGTHIRTIRKQQIEQDAVLRGMSEGVLAVSPQETLITINRSARDMLRIQRRIPVGTHLREFVRSRELIAFVARTLSEEASQEGTITLEGETTLHVHGSRLTDADGAPLGGMIVLHDVTELRRLENIRRDFVSNVSHELKTPITLIQGFVETLLNGAIHDPAHAERFLGIIARHTERLGSIIDDLLTLSRVEQEHEHGRVETAPEDLRDVVGTAIALCTEKADERNVRIVPPAGDTPCACDVNAPMLELALINLIDNAIRYSGDGTEVTVTLEVREGDAIITVADNGPGIAQRHLDRLFERFYCVDKARSRALGGTGLGLALVKHIAAAHGGTVAVWSREGRGSRFMLRLPCRAGRGADDDAA